MSHLRSSILLAVAIAVLGSNAVPTSPAHAQGPAQAACGWRSPVSAPIIDPFRLPEGPYGAGNRGIEYGASDGDPVQAVADGRVGFRGPVAGRLYLVIHHDGDLRSTYGPMATIGVLRGANITAGTVVGEAAIGFHLTARRSGQYIDPAPLLAGGCGPPRLVPVVRLATRTAGLR